MLLKMFLSMVPAEQMICIRVIETSEEISGSTESLNHYINRVLADAKLLEFSAHKSKLVVTVSADQRMIIFDKEDSL